MYSFIYHNIFSKSLNFFKLFDENFMIKKIDNCFTGGPSTPGNPGIPTVPGAPFNPSQSHNVVLQTWKNLQLIVFEKNAF